MAAGGAAHKGGPRTPANTERSPMAEPLGYLERVDPATVWKSEVAEFVPWLASEENIRRLGKALRLNLAGAARETPAGKIRADLLCRDLDTETVIVIEAQLGSSDHRHLGQLLTYAVAFRARAVVWLATRFHEEHRLVLEGLNRSGDIDVSCFAVEMDLWKVDASAAAPRFTVVVRPREWPFPAAQAPCGGAVAPESAQVEPPEDSPLRAWRKRTGMTLRQLGKAAGLSHTYLSHIEIGRCMGSPKARAAIVRALAAADEPGGESAG